MVFGLGPQRCLDVKENVLSKDLIVIAARILLFRPLYITPNPML
jgi:hypothetical protein